MSAANTALDLGITRVIVVVVLICLISTYNEIEIKKIKPEPLSIAAKHSYQLSYSNIVTFTMENYQIKLSYKNQAADLTPVLALVVLVAFNATRNGEIEI